MNKTKALLFIISFFLENGDLFDLLNEDGSPSSLFDSDLVCILHVIFDKMPRHISFCFFKFYFFSSKWFWETWFLTYYKPIILFVSFFKEFVVFEMIKDLTKYDNSMGNSIKYVYYHAQNRRIAAQLCHLCLYIMTILMHGYKMISSSNPLAISKRSHHLHLSQLL